MITVGYVENVSIQAGASDVRYIIGNPTGIRPAPALISRAVEGVGEVLDTGIECAVNGCRQLYYV